MRRTAATNPGISLFPFLAVLICTMGVMMLLLVVINRPGSGSGSADGAEAAGDDNAAGDDSGGSGSGSNAGHQLEGRRRSEIGSRYYRLEDFATGDRAGKDRRRPVRRAAAVGRG